MATKTEILARIKQHVTTIESTAKVILFGSRARGDNQKNSDFDILILLDRDEVTYQDEVRIKYPLYDIEFETGKVISPLILSSKDWNTRHSITPFYNHVMNEGVSL